MSLEFTLKDSPPTFIELRSVESGARLPDCSIAGHGHTSVQQCGMGLFRQYYLPIALYLIFLLAIENANKNPDILPNITLGYHVYDSCADGRLAVNDVLYFLSGPGKVIPNYSCMGHDRLVGIIGDRYSSTTIPAAQILGFYGYPQISYGSIDNSLSDGRLYPHVFRTVQNHHIHNMAITKLLQHFGWTWVGILVSDDETGENELQILTKYMRDHGICAAFIIKLKANDIFENILQILKHPEVKILIMCGIYSLQISFVSDFSLLFIDKTFIFPPSWISNYVLMKDDVPLYNGSLVVEISSQPFPGVEDFVKNHRKLPVRFQDNNFWRHLDLLTADADKDSYIAFNLTYDDNNSLEYIMPNMMNYVSSGVPPRLYYAVEVLAKALHEMLLFIKDKFQENSTTGFLQYTRKLQRYIQMTKNPPDPMTPTYYFNEHGEAAHPYKIINWIFTYNNSHRVIQKIDVGHYTPWAVSGQELYMNNQSVTWKSGELSLSSFFQIPVSRCSDQCLPGSWKKARETIHTCCYDCIPCPEGEISNITDNENCMKCQSDEWPNEKKDRCLPKIMEFISYQNDTIASVFSGVSVFGCLVTGFIFGIFISYRDTPIVRANNQNLSYLLLVSIFLSFLSVFLFLGRPTDVTCRLRETSFGIFFSVAISSLLAKTVMVCVAFKSTKPGSSWRKWLSVKLPYTIVSLCSSLQVVLCVIWLSISSPYQDRDTESYPGKIIIQCNEGSDIWFYSMLGYLGLLAAVSFVLAFMVRTLPDSFNEAKYITFSMLVFISVWISMIPAYLSTRGKNMVAVEIFAVMASSAGLLGCVFFPKCFIILFQSEMNRKTELLGKRKD
ncbi:vomeronasal type-2 receptor 26-like [Anomaloglossus baeobatrachus]|uniref:vomeronasal type-2 receptor 26-like n=1 Tax=Anomaloglossus baeobatrachus TaxID=238106 RepID=UPI003F50785B